MILTAIELEVTDFVICMKSYWKITTEMSTFPLCYGKSEVIGSNLIGLNIGKIVDYQRFLSQTCRKICIFYVKQSKISSNIC